MFPHHWGHCIKNKYWDLNLLNLNKFILQNKHNRRHVCPSYPLQGEIFLWLHVCMHHNQARHHHDNSGHCGPHGYEEKRRGEVDELKGWERVSDLSPEWTESSRQTDRQTGTEWQRLWQCLFLSWSTHLVVSQSLLRISHSSHVLKMCDSKTS